MTRIKFDYKIMSRQLRFSTMSNVIAFPGRDGFEGVGPQRTPDSPDIEPLAGICGTLEGGRFDVSNAWHTLQNRVREFVRPRISDIVVEQDGRYTIHETRLEFRPKGSLASSQVTTIFRGVIDPFYNLNIEELNNFFRRCGRNGTDEGLASLDTKRHEKAALDLLTSITIAYELSDDEGGKPSPRVTDSWARPDFTNDLIDEVLAEWVKDGRPEELWAAVLEYVRKLRERAGSMRDMARRLVGGDDDDGAS